MSGGWSLLSERGGRGCHCQPFPKFSWRGDTYDDTHDEDIRPSRVLPATICPTSLNVALTGAFAILARKEGSSACGHEPPLVELESPAGVFATMYRSIKVENGLNCILEASAGTTSEAWELDTFHLFQELFLNGNVDEACKILNRILGREGFLDQYRRTRYYEKPFQTRRRINYEKCKAIYDEDMDRKIKFVLRKNRVDPFPGCINIIKNGASNVNENIQLLQPEDR
ncbi:LOW QUALITY PROTEIN: Putative mitochondrial ribosomal protein [Gryllus bimaculatus]|nr:LOW QUALITY PROTEIN: Putative mitochondrial ribosomal protein [Gryllus bimaculatus]